MLLIDYVKVNLERWSGCIFPYSFPLSTNKNPGHYIQNKYKKTLEDVEKKAEQVGSSGPKEWHAGEFPAFSFFAWYFPEEELTKPTT